MNKPWFKAKSYGWGWYPASWEGWLVMVLYIAVVVSLLVVMGAASHSVGDTLITFALPFIGLTSLLISISYFTGEMPGWRWGGVQIRASNGLMSDAISSMEVNEKAPLIFEEIKKAQNILLHCHPSPDPDSVGSVLALKFALEQLGKKVTAISGDSSIPQAFMHFPGASTIEQKSFNEVTPTDYDLFIALDSGSIEMVSRKIKVEFPETLKVIVIDHHRTNPGYGSINIVDPSYPATAQILFDLFGAWGITLTPEIASNLFIGTYTDTGGFKFEGTKPETFRAAAELVRVVPDFPGLIARMENSTTPSELAFQGWALSAIETFLDEKLALSAVSFEMLKKHHITAEDVNGSMISTIMRRVGTWGIVGGMAEKEKGITKVSFRTNDANTYDVSKLAVALGGGGHKAAAGVNMNMSLEEAKALVVQKVKEVYNL